LKKSKCANCGDYLLVKGDTFCNKQCMTQFFFSTPTD
jgi:hypothetical protein